MSADYVTAFDVVTGDGVLRRATATENPALFWGLRGGKGTLGIVTAVEFDLVPLAEILGGCLFFDGADTAAVMHAWREWTATLPRAGHLDLWRGDPLADLAAGEWVRVAAVALHERRTECTEDLVTGLLGTGRTAQALVLARTAYAAQPLRGVVRRRLTGVGDASR